MSERPAEEARTASLPPADHATRPNATRALAVIVGAILVATGLAFATSLTAGFVYDDLRLISHNRFLVGHGALWRALTHQFWDTELAPEGETRTFYRPLVSALFVAVRALADSPAAFHAVVIALHLVAVFLVARLLRRIFDDEDVLAIGVGAGLFALHASRSQSVTWIVGVTDVLMAIPAILALTVVLPQRPRQHVPPSWRAGIIAALFTLLALGAKESAVTIPAAIAVQSWLLWDRGELRRAALIRFALPSACVAVMYLLLRQVWFPITTSEMGPAPVQHALFVFETIGRYAGITVWPWPLVFFRTAPSGTAAVMHVAPVWVVLGVLAAALIAWIYSRRASRGLVRLGIAWAVVFVAPALNIRWSGLTEVAADRFLYLPMLGIAVAVVAAMQRIPDVHRRAALLLVAGLGLAHGGSIALRAFDFRDDVTFWRVEDHAHPSVGLIESGLGSAELHDGHAGRAFVVMIDAYRLGERVALPNDLVTQLFAAVTTGALVTADDDRASLEGAANFAHGLLDPSVNVASGTMLGRAFRVDKRPIGVWIRHNAPHVRSFEAAVRSRLQDHASAITAADAAVASCTNNCIDVFMNAALVRARSRDWNGAIALTRRAGALDRTFAGAAVLERTLRTAAAGIARDTALLDNERTLREAQIDLVLTLPESARARLAAVPRSPRADLLRARVELLEFHFTEARALIEPLLAHAPSSAAPMFAELYELARAQQRRVEGL